MVLIIMGVDPIILLFNCIVLHMGAYLKVTLIIDFLFNGVDFLAQHVSFLERKNAEILRKIQELESQLNPTLNTETVLPGTIGEDSWVDRVDWGLFVYFALHVVRLFIFFPRV